MHFLGTLCYQKKSYRFKLVFRCHQPTGNPLQNQNWQFNIYTQFMWHLPDGLPKKKPIFQPLCFRCDLLVLGGVSASENLGGDKLLWFDSCTLSVVIECSGDHKNTLECNFYSTPPRMRLTQEQKIPPSKWAARPLKRDLFLNRNESSSNHQLSGDMLAFTFMAMENHHF